MRIFSAVKPTAAALTAGLFLAISGPAAMAEEPSHTIVIQNHRFSPSEINVPAGRRIKLIIRNLDPTPEEFESYELNREKVVPGGGTITIYIGPLRPGTYPFVGEFHEKTARGRVIAK